MLFLAVISSTPLSWADARGVSITPAMPSARRHTSERRGARSITQFLSISAHVLRLKANGLFCDIVKLMKYRRAAFLGPYRRL